MEPYIADLINNKKVPKIIRWGIVLFVCGFIIYIGINCGINSPMLWGRIFGYFLALLFLILGIFLCIRIYKN